MEYKNFKWKLANSMMIPFGLCCGIFLGILLVALVIIGEYSSIPLILLTVACATIPIYLIFLLVADIIYHKSKISIRDDGIYQNKRLLKYENIKEVYIGKMGQIYSFQISPIKDGVFVSKRIVLYFYSMEEVCHFIIVHNFSYILSIDYQYRMIADCIKEIINNCGEELHPDYIEFFNSQKAMCDCCGNMTIFKRIVNDVCPVCHWENDPDKRFMYNPDVSSDVNGMTLRDALKNFKDFGACKEEYKEMVRKPFSYELPDYINKKMD